MVPKRLSIPVVPVPVFVTVIVPEFVIVPSLVMPKLLVPLFTTAIVAPKLLVRIPPLKMPLLLDPLFATVIVPEFAMVPKLEMPLSALFDITSVVPDGITSSLPTAIEPPLVLTVHVVPTYDPPNHDVHTSARFEDVANAGWKD